MLLLYLSGHVFSPKAQMLKQPVAASFTGIEAYHSHGAFLFSYPANPGSLAAFNQSALGLYSERPYLLPELNRFLLVSAWPTALGHFGILGDYTGSRKYNESRIGLAYARSLGARIDAGIQFNYHHLKIADGYGQASFLSAEAGFVAHLTEKLHAGIQVSNPAGRGFGFEKSEQVKRTFSMGMGYEASAIFFTGIEILKEEDQPVAIQCGFSYRVIPRLVLRTGINTGTSSCLLSAGIETGLVGLEVSAAYHPELGITPGIGILLSPKKAKHE